MPFAEDTRTYDETRKRTSTAYIKFSEDYRLVLRILNSTARPVWKHWIKESNGGKGMMANCPNVSAQVGGCPIELSLKGLSKEDAKTQERRAKKRYIVNVLDRTPYTVCGSCNNQTPAISKSGSKVCINCGADVKKSTFVPLNKVKILEGGPQLFTQTLNPVEKMAQEDWSVDITGYDITFQTSGEGRERRIAAIPQNPVPLEESDFLDAESGEPQRLFDLELLAEPNSIEEIELMMKGATYDELNAIRGIV